MKKYILLKAETAAKGKAAPKKKDEVEKMRKKVIIFVYSKLDRVHLRCKI